MIETDIRNTNERTASRSGNQKMRGSCGTQAGGVKSRFSRRGLEQGLADSGQDRRAPAGAPAARQDQRLGLVHESVRGPARVPARTASRIRQAAAALLLVLAALLVLPLQAQAQTTPLWSTTMTVGEGTNISRGFNSYSNSFGALDDDEFMYASTTITVTNLVARSWYGNGEGVPGAVNAVALQINNNLTDAQADALILEFAGETLALADATHSYTTNRVFYWSDTWLTTNASSLNFVNYQTTLADGGTVNACLRTADQVCGSGTTLSTDATLSALTLEDASDDSTISLNETFASTTTDYTADADSDVDQITVLPTRGDDNATLVYLDGDDATLTDADTGEDDFQVDLDEGDNTIKIKVTAQDTATEETYTLVVTRASTDPVWSTTMTVAESTTSTTTWGYGDKGGSNPFGSVGTHTFMYNSTSYRVFRLDARDPTGTPNDEVRLEFDTALPDPVGLILEWAGAEFDLDDASSISVNRKTVDWRVNDGKLPSSSPLHPDNVRTTIPPGAMAPVCLRTASQTCPGGSIVLPSSNAAPTFDDGASTTRSFNETIGNATISTAANIGAAVAATDTDSGDTLSYSLEGTDAAKFGIVSTSGQIQTKVGEKYDHEDDDEYEVTVKVDDGNSSNNTATIAVTIAVNDRNERPLKINTPTLSVFSETQITIDWNAPNNAGRPAFDNISARHRTNGAASWQNSTFGSNVVSNTVGTLNVAVEYEFQVRYENPEGDGPWSDSVVGSTASKAKPLAPAAPTVTATSGSTTSLDVSWAAPVTPSGEVARPVTRYDLRYKKPAATGWTNGPQNQTGTSASIGSLDASEAYEVQVRAENANGSGPWSVSRTGSTDNAAPTFDDGASTTRSFDETIGNATVATAANIGDAVAATDTDTGDTLTYSLEGTDAAKFGIVSTSGQIQTKVGEKYSRETKNEYEVTVKVDDGNNSADTIVVTLEVDDVDEPPLKPARPTFGQALSTATSLDIDWVAPDNLGRPALGNRTLRHRRNGAGNWTNNLFFGGSSFTVTSLQVAVEYEFQVRYSNNEGDGPWSNSLVQSTAFKARPVAPAAPTVTVTSGSTTSLDVNWAAPVTPSGQVARPAVTNYDLQYKKSVDTGWTDGPQNHTGMTTVSIGSLEANVSYDIQVRAQNTNGNGAWSDSGTAFAGGSPDATLSNLELRDASDASAIGLNQTFADTTTAYTADADSDVEQITVLPTKGNDNATLAYLDGDDATLTDADMGEDDFQVDLDEGVNTIKIKVTAENNSTVATYTLAVTRADPDNTAPTFDDGVSTTRSFNETIGNATVATAANIGAAVAATDTDAGDTLTYSLEGTDAAKFGIVSTSGRIQTKVGEKYDHEADDEYAVTVKVEDGSGGSDTIAVTIGVNDRSEPPLKIGTPTLTVTSGTLITINWNAPNNAGRPGFDNIGVRHRTTGVGSWASSTLPSNVDSATFSSLSVAVEYEFQVRYENPEGDGPRSDSVVGSTAPKAKPVAPAAPTVTATSGSTTSLDVNWAAPVTPSGEVARPAVTSYDLRYKKSADTGWTDGPQNHTGTTTVSIGSLEENTEYEVQVRGENTNGKGAWSNSTTRSTGNLSGDATLSALTLKNASDDSAIGLNETFADSTTDYTTDTNSDVMRITVLPTRGDDNATLVYLDGDDATLTDADTVKDDFQFDLDEGDNTLKIKVTAEDTNTVETYTVVVTRAVAALPADPDTLVSNNEQTPRTAGARVGSTSGASQRQAQRFHTGDNPGGYTLSAVKLHIKNYDAGDVVEVKIRKDNGSNRPGDNVDTLDNPTLSSTAKFYTFTPSQPVTLDPEENYFVVIAGSNAGPYTVGLTDETDEDTDSESDWTIKDDRLKSTSNTGSWSSESQVVRMEITGAAAVSTDATLSALTLENDDGDTIALLSPEFDPATETYTAKAYNQLETVTLTATKNHTGAAVVITNDDDTNTADKAVFDLSVGSNALTVTVTAGDGVTTKTYTVTVTRLAAPPAPTDCPANATWCSTMRAAYDTTTTGATVIESRGYLERDNFGDIESTTFSHNGVDYGISAVSWGVVTTSGSVDSSALSFSTAPGFLPDGTVLRIGSREFIVDADSQTIEGTDVWNVQDNPLTWTEDENLTISLKFPSAPTGKPGITGAAQVGMTLTAGTSDIDDPDGLTSPGYTYQWRRAGADISGATSSTYLLTSSDYGEKIQVEVEFTDDANTTETLISEETIPVAPAAAACPTDAATTWCTTLTLGHLLDGSGNTTNSGFEARSGKTAFGSLGGATFTHRGVSYTTTALVGGSGAAEALVFATTPVMPQIVGIRLTMHLQTYGGELSAALRYSDYQATDQWFFDGLLAAVTADGATLSDVPLIRSDYVRSRVVEEPPDLGTEVMVRLSVSNFVAAGNPGITGTAQVGQELTATTDGITDAEGKTKADADTAGYEYSYQWVRVDGTNETDITGATSKTYTLAAADLGKTIKVKVTFRDDSNFFEGPLASAATAAVIAAATPDALWSTTMTVAVSTRVDSSWGYGNFGGGFDPYGSVGAHSFMYNSTSYRVWVLTADDPTGTANDKVYLQFSEVLPDPAGLILEWAGAEFDLNDASAITGGRSIFEWKTSDGKLPSAAPQHPDNVRTELPVGAMAPVCLRTASQTCPGGSIVLPPTTTAMLSFAGQNITVDEDVASGLAEITVQLTPALASVVTVDYETTQLTATPGQDYTAVSGTLTFAANETSETIEIPILNDNVYEPLQRFGVTLSNASGAVLPSSPQAAVNIVSDEAAPVASIADVSVGEGSGTMRLTLQLDRPSEQATSYDAIPADVGGTATVGVDYTNFVPGTSRSITVPAGQTSATLDIAIIDDAMMEDNETITVSWLVDPTLGKTEATPGIIRFTGTIVDDDGDNTPPAFTGGMNQMRDLAETVGAATATAADVGSAVSATDDDSDTLTYFLGGADANRFSIGSTTGQIRTVAGQRYDYETQQSFSVTVRVNDGAVDITANVTVNLTNADEPPLAPPAPIVTPTPGSATSLNVRWSAPGNDGRPVISGYDLRYRRGSSGSWTNGPQNQTGTSAAISGLAEDTGYQVQVRAANDEGNGAFSTTGAGSTRSPSSVPRVHTGDQTWWVSFDQDAYTATEGGAGAEVTLSLRLNEPPWAPVLDHPLEVPLYQPEPLGGATSADYSDIPEIVTFHPGSTTTSFTVTATDDNADDDGESVLLQFPSALPGNLDVGRGAFNATVHLQDNDGQKEVTASFGALAYTAEEGGSDATVRVRLDAAPDRQVVIPLTATNEGASSSDYSGVPASVTFGVSETVKTFVVTATDDSVDDDLESVTLGFGELPSRVLAGDPSETVVNLTDNDAAESMLTLNMDAYKSSTVLREVSEGISYSLHLSLDRKPKNAVTIPLQVEYTGGATAADVTGVPVNVTFEAGTKRVSLSVGAVDDTEADPGEGFVVSFGTMPAGVEVGEWSGGPEREALARFRIIDNDANPGLTISDASVREGTSLRPCLNFWVTLDRKVDYEVRVDYQTVDGTALAGEDYIAASGTLVFWPSERTKSKRLCAEVINDSHDEGVETMTMVLSNPVGANLVDATATGRISNSGQMPGAWLARFGRVASDHVIEAVADRWQDGPQASHLTIGGRQVGEYLNWGRLGTAFEGNPATTLGSDPSEYNRRGSVDGGPADGGSADSSLADGSLAGGGSADDSLAGRGSAGGAFAGGGFAGSGPAGLGASSEHSNVSGGRAAQNALLRTLGLGHMGVLANPRDLLMGSSFFYSRPLDEKGQARTGSWLGDWSTWGRTAASRFSGADGKLSLNGEVATAMLGVDSRWDRWFAGLVLSYSDGEGRYSQPHATGGTVDSMLTALHPYVRFELSERTSLWGMLGYGVGELSLTPVRSDTALRTGLTNAMAAFGGRTTLSVRLGQAGRFELAVRSDARLTNTVSDSIEGLVGTAGATSRVRLMLEGSGSMPLAIGGMLKPKLEAGVRYDAGDAETGAGLEIGGGLGYAAGRLGVEITGRALLAHQDAEYKEWGFSGSLAYTAGKDGRGLSMKLGSAWGSTQSGVQSLWTRQDASGLARNAAFEAAQRFQAELGYGIAGRGKASLWVPLIKVQATGGGGQEIRMGVRFTSGPDVAAGLEFGQLENVSGGREHAVQLTGMLLW